MSQDDEFWFGQPLTESEFDLLLGAAEGERRHETAERRWVSAATVAGQWKRIHGKLGSKTQAHAVALAYHRHILLPPEHPTPVVAGDKIEHRSTRLRVAVAQLAGKRAQVDILDVETDEPSGVRVWLPVEWLERWKRA